MTITGTIVTSAACGNRFPFSYIGGEGRGEEVLS